MAELTDLLGDLVSDVDGLVLFSPNASFHERFEEVDAPVDARPREQLAWLRDHFGRTDPRGREEGDGLLDGGEGPARDQSLVARVDRPEAKRLLR